MLARSRRSRLPPERTPTTTLSAIRGRILPILRARNVNPVPKKPISAYHTIEMDTHDPINAIPNDRSSAGDQPALTPELVFRDYAPRVYNLARRMLGNDADAEDVTQDVLLQVVRKLDTFRGESAFPTWLHRVTVNAALASRRKRATREQHTVRDPLEHFLENGHPHHSPWSVRPEQAALDRET